MEHDNHDDHKEETHEEHAKHDEHKDEDEHDHDEHKTVEKSTAKSGAKVDELENAWFWTFAAIGFVAFFNIFLAAIVGPRL